ncbi:MAG: thiol-disulfide oxidoreductase DCC family protein [Kiritimatiellia bacterium]
MSELPLLLFDGPCTLCQRSVRFILRHEKASVLHFASLQSETGQRRTASLNLPPGTDAMILLEEHGFSTASDAAFRVCAYLRYPWRLGYSLRFLPGFLHRPVYRWIAKNRYRWFGQDESCPLPDPKQAARFLK